MSDDCWIDDLPPLVRAAARGNLGEALRLLAQGAEPSQAQCDGWTALHAAARWDHTSVVGALLAAGAAVEACDARGFTPLLNAAGASAATVALLLEAGADPMAEVPDLQWRPADRFAEFNNAPALGLVLDAGARPDAPRLDGWTALADAAEAGAHDCIMLLINAGADPTRLFNGATASELAAAQGHRRTSALLADLEASHRRASA